jgi:2-polyprenyl-3-methyl-5-hydroxy-6-metoxy-1,4-benzoquinol methylase
LTDRGAYDAWHAKLPVDAEVDTPWHLLLREHIDPSRDLRGKRVLEVGCGRGGFAVWLAQQSSGPPDLVATDLSKTAIQKARHFALQRGQESIAWQVGSVQQLPHRDKSFDTVICAETIEHVPDPARAMRELARTLKRGGRLFLTTPNYLGPMGLFRAYRRVVRRPFAEEGQPINRVTLLPRTRMWIRRSGLSITKTDTIGHYLPFPGRPPINIRFPAVIERALWWLGLHSLFVAEKL